MFPLTVGLDDVVDVRPVFRGVRSSLLQLVESLTPAEWEASTPAAPWLVRDVVAHLLGDDLGRLSRSRDGHLPEGPSKGESLPGFLDRHNAEWVHASQRMSAHVLVELLAVTSEKIAAYWDSADLAAEGEPVSWAGPGPAPQWLDCARDFTEDWVHQQQIREGLSRSADDAPAVLGAVIETFMHAVPHTLGKYAPQIAAGDAATVAVVVEGQAVPSARRWTHTDGEWIRSARVGEPTATVSCSADTWWRLCVRMLTPEEARARSRISGDQRLGNAVLQTLAIIREP